MNVVRYVLCGTMAFVVSLLSASVASAALTSPLAGLQFRSIGPAIAGGRTTAIVGSNSDPMVYYAGGAGGGVFKSTDGGVSWNPVFDAQPVAPIGAIAVSPTNPNDVWVGTGEAYPRNTSESGDGMYHSTDGGKTWHRAGLVRSQRIARISIDPRDTNTVAVGVLGNPFADSSDRGVYVTHDGGAHWTHTLSVGPASGASDLVRSPDHPSTLYAGIWQFRRSSWHMSSGGPLDGIYRSLDYGTTWKKLVGNGLPGVAMGRIGLAAGPNNRVYAIIQTKHGELWRSDNAGTSWQAMPENPLLGARPFYFNRIYIDPADANRLINVSLILSMSTDGGKTFKPISLNAGWDYHFVWWSHDGRRVAIGSDEGVVMSNNGMQTVWQPYDLPFAQPYRIGFDHSAPYYNVCIGLQDDNTWCGPSSSTNGIGVLNRDWYQVAPGDGMWAVFDPKDANLVWSTSTASDTGQVYLSNIHTLDAREVSPDAEITENAASALKYRFNWESPVTFTNDGKALVGGNVVFESADHGQTWKVISPDLTRNDRSHQMHTGGPITRDESGAEISDTILDIGVSALADGTMWVGTDDGVVQLTRNAGATWTNVTPKAMPSFGRVPTVEVGHYSAATAYIAVDHHMSGDDRPYIFVTDNYGKSWKSISGDLPSDLFVRSIREDHVNPQLLYAGTQRGVYVSFDRGTHWQSLRGAMPATAIYDLEIQPDANDLLVASHGRGVWILDDLRPLQEWAKAKVQPVTLFAIRPTDLTWLAAPIQRFLEPPVPSNIYVGKNAPYGALITYNLGSKPKKIALDILDEQHHIIRHLTGKDAPMALGMNRTAWDLTVDGPTIWKGTFLTNQPYPSPGARVVPGTYVVRLTVDGKSVEQSVRVNPDPRTGTSARPYEEHYAAVVQLNAELSDVDRMLNAIDARLPHAGATEKKALVAFLYRLTINPKNIEDLQGPAKLRERILDMLSRLSSSYQGPNQPQQRELAAIAQAYAKAKADFDHSEKVR